MRANTTALKREQVVQYIKVYDTHTARHYGSVILIEQGYKAVKKGCK